jgi:hypothetical protein
LEQGFLESLREKGFLCGHLGVLNWGIFKHPDALMKHISLLSELASLEAALVKAIARDREKQRRKESLSPSEAAL